MRKISFLSVVAILSLVSCTKDALVGSGEIITEVRTLSAFDKIQISGDRETVVVKSNEYKVEVTGYTNLVDNYKEEVKSGNLSFEYPAFTRVRKDNIKLKIYTPDLSFIALSGNTDILIAGGFELDRLDLQLSGNTHVQAEAGRVNALRIDASGNPQIYIKSIVAKEVDLHLSGNPKVELFAEQKLAVHASGRGRIKYWGSPSITSFSVSGDVKIERQ